MTAGWCLRYRGAGIPDPAHDHVRQRAFALLKAVPGSSEHHAAERPSPHGIPPKGVDHLLGRAVEILVAASDDRRNGKPHRSERRPPGARPIIREDVLVLTRTVQADVAPGAPEAPRSRDEGLRIPPGDPLGGGHAPAELPRAEVLRLARDVGDRTEQDEANHPPVSDARRVVENLVGAGRVPGQDHLAVAAGGGERDHRPDVRHALAETLEGRAGEILAALGDDVMAAVLNLKYPRPAALSRLDSSWISACPEENTDPRPCTQMSAVPRRRL